MSVVVQVAEAVMQELNGATFSLPFTAKRLYHPVFELSDMATLHVTVVPKGMVIALSGRNHNQHECKIDVAVQKKYGSDLPEEMDPLMDLVEEIADHFRHKTLSAFPQAVWTGTEHKPIFAPEHMEQLRQFTSVVTLTFKLLR